MIEDVHSAGAQRHKCKTLPPKSVFSLVCPGLRSSAFLLHPKFHVTIDFAQVFLIAKMDSVLRQRKFTPVGQTNAVRYPNNFVKFLSFSLGRIADVRPVVLDFRKHEKRNWHDHLCALTPGLSPTVDPLSSAGCIVTISVGIHTVSIATWASPFTAITARPSSPSRPAWATNRSRKARA